MPKVSINSIHLVKKKNNKKQEHQKATKPVNKFKTYFKAYSVPWTLSNEEDKVYP